MLIDSFFGDGYFTSKTLYSKGTGEFRRMDYNADNSSTVNLTPNKYIFHEGDYFQLRGNYVINPDDNLKYYYAIFHFITNSFDGTPIDPNGFFTGECWISEYQLKHGATVTGYNSDFWFENGYDNAKYAKDIINRIIDLNIATFKNVLYCARSFETVTGIATGDYRNITAQNINNPDVYHDLWNRIAELKKNSSYVDLAQRLWNIISQLDSPLGAFAIGNKGFKNVEYTNVNNQFQDNLTTFISTVGPLFLGLDWGEVQQLEHVVIARCEFDPGYEELIISYLKPHIAILEKNFTDSQQLVDELGGLPVTTLTTTVPVITVIPPKGGGGGTNGSGNTGEDDNPVIVPDVIPDVVPNVIPTTPTPVPSSDINPLPWIAVGLGILRLLS